MSELVHNVAAAGSTADLFVAHHTLTGSCLMGRRQFARDHGIDVEHGNMTIGEFIELTKHAYGATEINKLYKVYKNGKHDL